MINVLESISKVANKLIKVEINNDKIQEFVSKVTSDDLKVSEIALAKYD